MRRSTGFSELFPAAFQTVPMVGKASASPHFQYFPTKLEFLSSRPLLLLPKTIHDNKMLQIINFLKTTVNTKILMSLTAPARSSLQVKTRMPTNFAIQRSYGLADLYNRPWSNLKAHMRLKMTSLISLKNGVRTYFVKLHIYVYRS